MTNYKEFTWESNDHSPMEFIHRYRNNLPVIVKVTQGYCGTDDDDEYNFPAEEIYRIKEIKQQIRAIFTDSTDQKFSIPVTYPVKFHIMNTVRKRGIPQPLEKLQHELIVGTEVVMENNRRRTFYMRETDSDTIKNKLQFETLKFQAFQIETFLVGNCIVHVTEWPSIVIPYYVDTRLALADGVKGGTREDFDSQSSNIARICAMLTSKDVQGNQEIMLLDGDMDGYKDIKPKQYVREEQISTQPVPVENTSNEETCKTAQGAAPRNINDYVTCKELEAPAKNTCNNDADKMPPSMNTNNGTYKMPSGTLKSRRLPPPLFKKLNLPTSQSTVVTSEQHSDDDCKDIARLEYMSPKSVGTTDTGKIPETTKDSTQYETPLSISQSWNNQVIHNIQLTTQENKRIMTDKGTLKRGRLPPPVPKKRTSPPSQPTFVTSDDSCDDYKDTEGNYMTPKPTTKDSTQYETPSSTSQSGNTKVIHDNNIILATQEHKHNMTDDGTLKRVRLPPPLPKKNTLPPSQPTFVTSDDSCDDYKDTEGNYMTPKPTTKDSTQYETPSSTSQSGNTKVIHDNNIILATQEHKHNMTDDGTLKRGRLPPPLPKKTTLPPSQPTFVTSDDSCDDYKDTEGNYMTPKPTTKDSTQYETPSSTSQSGNTKVIHDNNNILATQEHKHKHNMTDNGTLKRGRLPPPIPKKRTLPPPQSTVVTSDDSCDDYKDTEGNYMTPKPTTKDITQCQIPCQTSSTASTTGTSTKLVTKCSSLPTQGQDNSVSGTDTTEDETAELGHYRGPESNTYQRICDIPQDVSHLTVHEVAQCLQLLKLEKHVIRFNDEDVDGSLLCELDKNMLISDFKFSVFEATKLMKFVKNGWRPT